MNSSLHGRWSSPVNEEIHDFRAVLSPLFLAFRFGITALIAIHGKWR